MEKVLRFAKRKGWLLVLLAVSLGFVFLYGYYWMKINVPSEMKLLLGQEEKFDFSVPMEASITGEEAAGVLYINQEPLSEDVIDIDLLNPFSVSSDSLGEYEVQLKLFGLFQPWQHQGYTQGQLLLKLCTGLLLTALLQPKS